MAEKFIVKKSDIDGNGIFAFDRIKKGEIICVFAGERVTVPELEKRFDAGTERFGDPLEISEEWHLDLDKPFVYFNHSCEPNAGMVKLSTLVALRDIDKGEEIKYDYSTTEWTQEHTGKYKKWEMECRCGSPSCRKVIKQFPLLPRKVRFQYLKNGVLQDYILRKAKNIPL